jgi:hypothetical protein
MARCPFARWDEISGAVGAYSGGPFKIVHHTTEGSSYAGARAAYAAHRSDPHFTVAGDTIFQHIDTSLAGRALKNRAGGVQTNRDSAVQIEVVAFAGQPKDVTTLQSVARLCRWIEQEHGIPQAWPNGLPRFSTTGGNPGGHNRDASHWDALGGHYGHSQVPENDHWDPGYTPAEVAIVTPEAIADPHGALAQPSPAAAPTLESVALAAQPEALDVEAIVARVVERVRALAPTGTLTVRVEAEGLEIEVSLETSVADARPRGRRSAARRRTTKPRPRR